MLAVGSHNYAPANLGILLCFQPLLLIFMSPTTLYDNKNPRSNQPSHRPTTDLRNLSLNQRSRYPFPCSCCFLGSALYLLNLVLPNQPLLLSKVHFPEFPDFKSRFGKIYSGEGKLIAAFKIYSSRGCHFPRNVTDRLRFTYLATT